MKKVSIVIADDHPIIRKAVKNTLRGKKQFRIIGEANNGLELLKFTENHLPDIAIIDLEMPVMKGYETIHELRKLCPGIKTIAFSGFLTESNQARAIKMGADATLCKTEPNNRLITALEAVIKGESYHSDVSGEHDTTLPGMESEDVLTLREKQILTLIATGKTSIQISRECNISKWTVDKHRANIKEKLGLGTLAEMVKYAMHHGYIAR